MTDQPQSTPQGLLLNWVFLTTGGYVIGLALRRTLADVLLLIFGTGQPIKLVEGALIGVAIGWLQLMVFPDRLPRSRVWVVGSGLGWAIGWGYGWSLTRQIFGDYDLVYLIVGGLAGFGAGLIQLLLLYRHIRQSGWWLGGSTLGWAGGSATSVLISGVLGWPIGGVVAGLVTGLTLLWLLKPDYQAQAS